ncbi:hypothetical protein OVS_00725 [Mycoplasma ovis str. Michigan]|uniref:Uncharacterized protein n=2 Tax=Mycoplasma ovis TaxID=171632 RepID=A0ABM5P102_9MOLU|nr:hypothetical protein OVS_00725 [Mycoplasma ovis str. Michigan]
MQLFKGLIGLFMPLSIFGIPLLTAIGDSVDDGQMDGFKAKGGKIYQNADGNFLRERNPIAFGFTNDSAGEAWRLTKSGKVYKDESIFGFKDYSWLNGKAEGGHTISGGEKFKTLISGLGIRVKEITGPCILVSNKNGAKWKDLRSCPENSEKTRREGQVITRHLDVDLVPLVNQKATDDQLSYLGRTVCMARLITKNKQIDNLSSLGFIFAVGTGFENDKNKSLIGDQMKWDKTIKISLWLEIRWSETKITRWFQQVMVFARDWGR